MHELFQPLTPGFVHAEANNTAELIALTEKYPTAGILLECVQGEGGVVPLTRNFLVGAAKLCKWIWTGTKSLFVGKKGDKNK